MKENLTLLKMVKIMRQIIQKENLKKQKKRKKKKNKIFTFRLTLNRRILFSTL